MKINRLMLNMVKSFVVHDIKNRRKNYPNKDEFKHWENIPYLNDQNKYHTYDVYLADESNRKHCCFIDIHGGSYIFGEHQDNFPYAYVLLKAGFDVVLLDYVPNNGKKDTKDLLSDCTANLIHLKEHLKEYDLEKDKFVMTGDSAGGHISFLLSLLMQEPSLKEVVGLDVPSFDIIATVLACPVYDFANLGKWSMTKSGLKRMLGPRYIEHEHLETLSPRTYVSYNKLPLFLSTCKRDFIREESMKLNEDMNGKKGYYFVDIDSDDKNIDHVHNIVKTQFKESIEVNNAIVKFVDNLL